jgi:hypothetical protein
VKEVVNSRAGIQSGARRWRAFAAFLPVIVALAAAPAWGQGAVYSWANFAGQPGGYGNADGSGSDARFNNLNGTALDAAGNVYVADSNNHTIRKVTPGGVVTTLAGSAGVAGSADGTGSAAQFNYPTGVAVDASGNVYVADSNNHTIRKVTAAGVVTTLAGNAGVSGSADDTGTAAQFNLPQGVAVTAAGTVYVADYGNHTIRRVTAGGVVTTLAGSAGNAGSTDGTGSAALFRLPAGVALDGAGNVYVADFANHTIRKVTSAGVTTTLAGSAGSFGSANGTGGAAQFNHPSGVTVDGAGKVFVADYFNHTIRQVTPGGVVTTLAGSAGNAGSANGTGSAARFNYPAGVAVDAAGNVFVADSFNHTVRQVTSAGVVTTLAGNAGSAGSADGTGNAALFRFPTGVAADAAGNVYVADFENHTIRKATAAGVVTTLAGSAGTKGSADGTGDAALFSGPTSVAADGAGNVYVADYENHTIRKVTPGGVVTTLAGSAGSAGYTDATGSAAQFYYPYGVAVDGAGNVYVADSYNHAIRKVTPGGAVTTLAGGGAGYADGTGTGAQFYYPYGVAVDGAGNVYVADSYNHAIRKVTPGGAVTTLAGSAGIAGSADGARGTALFNYPTGVAVNHAGGVYVADAGNHTLRLVSPRGDVCTVGGVAGVIGGADGRGRSANFASPAAVALGADGLLYVADLDNNRISKGTPVDTLYAVFYKIQGYAQTNTGAAVLLPPEIHPTPFSFEAGLKQTPNGTVNSVSLGLPDASTHPMGPVSPPSNQADFEYKQEFATKSQMDAAFGTGAYSFSINAAHDGAQSLSLNIAADGYPSGAPHISNWTNAQAVYPPADFTLAWDALPGGASNDFVLLQVREMVSGTPSNFVFQTEAPGAGSALSGTNVSAVIPGGTLAQGKTYLAQLLWAKRASVDTNNYPGAVGAAMHGLQTMFYLTTTTPSQMLSPTNNSRLAAASVTFTWNSGVGVAQNALWVGSAPASYDLYAAIESGRSRTLTLPTDGRPIYLRLWSQIAGGWQFVDYTYTAYRPLVVGFSAVLPESIYNNSYSQTLQALGGVGAYTWSWLGATPSGLNLSASGTLSGTPTAMGVYNFTIQVRDELGTTVSQNVSLTVRGQDVSYAMAIKQQLLWQTNTGAAVSPPPSLDPTPFAFAAVVKQAPTSTVNAVTVQCPDSTVRTLAALTPPPPQYCDWLWQTNVATKVALDAAVTNGVFTFTIGAAHDGTNTLAANLSADNYPSTAPHISNWDAAQAVNSAANFTLTWDALAGATTNDFVWVQVTDEAAGGVHLFETPAWGRPGALNGASRSVTLPGGTLTTNHTYQAQIGWCRFGALDTASYPGASGAGAHAKVTAFQIQTTAPAQMLSPTNGTVFAQNNITFNWTRGKSVSQYALWVGSASNGYDLAAMALGTNLAQTLTLPATSQPIYARLWSLIGSEWQSVDYGYTGATPVKPQMLSPANGSTNSSSLTTFTWNSGVGASQYALWVGNAPNGHDLAAIATGTNLSQQATVPATGQPFYVRLWALINGAWQGSDYNYTAPTPARAEMSSPANGSTNSSASVTFNWTAGAGVSQYALWVGSASNSSDLYAAVEPGLSRTLSLPVDGRSLYVRLWSQINGAWLSNDYTYRAFNTVKARFTGLSNGATFGSASVTLTWDSGVGASQYALWVGSALGSYDLYASALGTNLSKTLTLPADGRQIYVSLWSLINGAWVRNNYLFTAYTAPNSRAAMITPTNGTVFVSNLVTLTWSAGTGVSQYALWAGSTPGSHGLLAQAMNTNRTYQLTVPLDGAPVYVRLWSLISGAWESNDYAYGTTGPTSKAEMTSPANGTDFTAASTTFTWSAGTGASQYALWAGSAPGTYDLYAASAGTNLSRAVTLPVDGGPIYVRLWSLISGAWKSNDYFYMAYLAP